MSECNPTRRQYLLAAGASSIAVLSGCSSGGDDGSGQGNGETGNGTPTEAQTPTDATPTPADADDLTSWWTSHADPERTRSTPDPVPGSLERVGTFELETIRLQHTHPLVTPEGMFFFQDDLITGYDLASRERTVERSLRPIWTFVRDGTIVVAGNNLLGLNASTGEREWIASVEFDRAFTVDPVPGGVAVAAPSGTPLRVLDVESGEERWSNSGGPGGLVNRTGDVNPAAGVRRAGTGEVVSGRRMAPVVHTESDTIIIGIGPRVDAFDTQTGDRKWRFRRDSSTFRPVPFAIRGETVYVQGGGGLLALDRTDGGVRWERTGSDGTQSPFVGNFAYAVDDTALYFWNAASEVHALSVDDGSTLWSTAFTGDVTRVSSAVAGDGVVFTTANGVRVLSKSTGESRLSTDVRGAGAVVPAGGRLYIRTTSDRGHPRITVYGSS